MVQTKYKQSDDHRSFTEALLAIAVRGKEIGYMKNTKKTSKGEISIQNGLNTLFPLKDGSIMTNDYNDPLITLAIAANLDFDGDIITVINKITGDANSIMTSADTVSYIDGMLANLL